MGQRQDRQTTARPLNDSGDRIVLEAAHYTIQYFDHAGRRRKVSTRCADKDAALQLANQLETKAMQRRSGLIDTTAERFASEARRNIREHIADFRAHLTAKGRTARHVVETCRCVEKVVSASVAEYAKDVTSDAVLRKIAELRGDGSSLRTCNAYLCAIKTFTRWLWREKRTPDDALAGLSLFNEATDRRHVRRELTPEELTYLLWFVETRTMAAHNMSGPDRAMLYRTALGTGFRAKELRSLMPASFNLDADPPTVTVEAAYSKHRRPDVQPIRPASRSCYGSGSSDALAMNVSSHGCRVAWLAHFGRT